MSLILDALKKTESSKDSASTTEQTTSTTDDNNSGGYSIDAAPTPVPSPTQTFNQNTTETKTTIPGLGGLASKLDTTNKKKLIILIALAVFGLSFIVYIAFSRGLSELFSSDTDDNQTTTIPITQPIEQEEPKIDPKQQEQEIIQLKKEAIALFRSSKYQESADIYKKLVNLLPASPEIYNNYGLALKKSGRTIEAKQTYQIALALNQDYPECLNNLATIEISEQKFNEAKENLLKALELNPSYYDAHLHLAFCYEKIGDNQKAIEHYQQFLDLTEGKKSRKLRLQIETRIAELTDELNTT